jgi:anti-sigma factor RsiW
MKPDLELKLQALLDAELPPGEAEEMRRLAASDQEAARLLAELRNITTVLRQNEPAAAVREPRPFYWSKIQRQIERESARSASPAPSWAERFRRWLTPLAAATAGVAALLLLLNRTPPQAALNEVSPAAGARARALGNNSADVKIVAVKESQPASGTLVDTPPARTRNDGSSFVVELD